MLCRLHMRDPTWQLICRVRHVCAVACALHIMCVLRLAWANERKRA